MPNEATSRLMVARPKGIERDRLKHSKPGVGLMQRPARKPGGVRSFASVAAARAVAVA
jgi:hypothetical protein